MAALPEVRIIAVCGLEGKGVARLPPAYQISGFEVPRGLGEGAAVVSAYRQRFLKTRKDSRNVGGGGGLRVATLGTPCVTRYKTRGRDGVSTPEIGQGVVYHMHGRHT